MKTDNDDSVRVTVTFRRESNPEWFALLSALSSGRSRAEIVREHLALPRSIRPSLKVIDDALAAASPVRHEKQPSVDFDKGVKPVTTVKNTDDEVLNSSTAENNVVHNQPLAPSPLVESAAKPAAQSSRGRSGMAATLINKRQF